MNIDQIIAKVFSGKATQEELEALNLWKAEAEGNIKAIKEMQSIDETIAQTATYKDYDVDSAWASMEASMDTPAEQVELVSEAKTVRLPWLRHVAAAIAVCAVALVGWQMYSGSDTSDTSTKYLTAAEKVERHTLADGSTVTVDLASTVTRIGDRNLSLDGRAHFQVAKDEKQDFTVATNAGKITVLGTRFTVDTRADQFSIYVSEGKVRYDFRSHKIELKAGDLLTMYDGDPLVVKATDTDPDAWMGNKLSFRDELLSTVVPQLVSRYGQEIVIDNPKAVAKCRVNTTLSTETLSEVLNELSATLGLKYHTIDGVLHIVDSNC